MHPNSYCLIQEYLNSEYKEIKCNPKSDPNIKPFSGSLGLFQSLNYHVPPFEVLSYVSHKKKGRKIS